MDVNTHRNDQDKYLSVILHESVKAKSLRLLLGDELMKLFGTEKLQISYFSKLIGLTESAVIVDVLEAALADTRQHLRRLERVFALLGLPIPENVRSMDIITQLMMKEGVKAASVVKLYPVSSDRVIILEIQKVAHYQMVKYMNLIAWAKRLQLADISELMEDSLDDVINADLSLTELSESGINPDTP